VPFEFSKDFYIKLSKEYIKWSN